MTTLPGMIASDDFVTTDNPRYTWRPESWREKILQLYPNGEAPLTAMMSKMKSEAVTDPIFHWWTSSLPAQAGAVTGVYTNTGLSVAYTGGGVSGGTIYAKCAAATVAHFRAGHVAMLKDASDSTMTLVCKVTAATANGASSYLTLTLMEADDNSAHSHDGSDADRVIVIGSINSEGATIPAAISYEPDPFYNYTQIFRTPLDITRTAKKTRLRTEEQYKRAKREALELHSIEMEKAFWFGVLYNGTGSNGHPERGTRGIFSWIKSYASDNVDDYTLNSTYSGAAWTASGEAWLNGKLEQIFRYGKTEKMAFVGSKVLLAIDQLAKTGAQLNIQTRAAAYGIKVHEWITPYGVLYMKTHPLFSYEDTLRKTMAIVDADKLAFRYIDDTFFKKDTSEREGGQSAYDATKEEFLTEAGLEFHHPTAHGILEGLGGSTL